MKPSDKEIDAAIAEEAAAMKQLRSALSIQTKGELQVQAARKRLSLARSNKSSLMSDLMAFGISK